ncbi:UvrD-helicase domain-containing protein [Candidatus Microgenomates bacterium]|nr:UvrD-helicase domain-containing protein [Candidatus Microgenomates bacterium]
MKSFLLEDLNSQQQSAVSQTDGPILILAGAGSGKTRVLTYKIAYLIAQSGVSPENILALTFTNKAAAEMKNRIKKLVARSPEATSKLPWASTFHSFCARILRIEGKHIDLAPNFLIYDQADQKELIKAVLKKLDLSPKSFSPASVLNTISGAKNELISALEYLQYAKGFWQETVTKIYLEYQKALVANSALDFDDLLLKTNELFQKNSSVLQKYQDRFHHLLIDEYQDTNNAQYQLGKMLAGRWRNICVVGDASQSIYSWRGADFRNLTRFQEDFPDLKIFNLEQNYRSTQKILDAAYAVITHNQSHPILKLWTENPGGEKVNLYSAQNEHDEAEFIANTIINYNGVLGDFAVLYRTNAQSRVLEEVFLRSGLPYALVGGTRFYERREIKDVLAYLKIFHNPKDTVSLNRLEKIGKTRLKKFMEFNEVSKKNPERNLTTSYLLDQILTITGYLDLYDPKVEEELMRLENIKELGSVAQEFPDLGQFLENVALVEQEYLPDSSAQIEQTERITLMTLHTAKGLEFPVVFIIGMEEGIFPHSKSLFDKQELEEERRLCYVGFTRAKKMLYLTHAARRLFFGTQTANFISRFVLDLPENLVTPLSSQQTLRQGSFG